MDWVRELAMTKLTSTGKSIWVHWKVGSNSMDKAFSCRAASDTVWSIPPQLMPNSLSCFITSQIKLRLYSLGCWSLITPTLTTALTQTNEDEEDSPLPTGTLPVSIKSTPHFNTSCRSSYTLFIPARINYHHSMPLLFIFISSISISYISIFSSSFINYKSKLKATPLYFLLSTCLIRIIFYSFNAHPIT